MNDNDAEVDNVEPSPFDKKVESIAVVLDEFLPGQVLRAIQQLADDPDSSMSSGDIVTTASNISTDEEMRRPLGVDEQSQE